MSLVQELQKMYHDADGGERLFDWLATYRYRKTETLVDRASVLSGVPPPAVIAVFKQLSELNVGQFKHGRRTKKTRILWRYSPREIGEAAQGKLNQLQPYDEDELDELDAVRGDDAAESEDRGRVSSLPAAIERAKVGLASDLGISTEDIEIIIRN